jgi:hypothetical protein
MMAVKCNRAHGGPGGDSRAGDSLGRRATDARGDEDRAGVEWGADRAGRGRVEGGSRPKSETDAVFRTLFDHARTSGC